jgi:cytochrome bd-type quinol oxidase subunit 1
MDILWGHGWNNYLQKMGSFYFREKIVEIDYVDVFMINGLVGIVLVLAIWTWFLFQARSSARMHPAGKMAVFMNLLLLGIAGTAGHVFYSGLNAPFIAMLNALPILALRQQEEPAETGNAS